VCPIPTATSSTRGELFPGTNIIYHSTNIILIRDEHFSSILYMLVYWYTPVENKRLGHVDYLSDNAISPTPLGVTIILEDEPPKEISRDLTILAK
jgi:hypothetical protein